MFSRRADWIKCIASNMAIAIKRTPKLPARVLSNTSTTVTSQKNRRYAHIAANHKIKLLMLHKVTLQPPGLNISMHYFSTSSKYCQIDSKPLESENDDTLVEVKTESTNIEPNSVAQELNSATEELPPIPEPPPIPASAEIVENLTALTEPTFNSIGLGGWSPVGMVQQCMEILHLNIGLPWWCAIAFGTIVVRTLLFPLVIVAQRNAAKMNNYMPQLQMLQMKMTEARQSGNSLDSARYAQEMMIFMKEKGVNPLKNMLVPLAQAPLFLSFFMGLRQMANAPVESMRTGGLWWFQDLTLADPYFILPIITSATLMLTIEIGTDSARLNAANLNTMKYVLRALPLIIFPFTMNFPAAILTYWACSNFISLGQVAILRIPSVREYFKIDKMVTHSASELPAKKGFIDGMKDSWENIKITKEIEERQRVDEMRFARAGKGPLQKTYKYDPTKPSSDETIAKLNLKFKPNENENRFKSTATDMQKPKDL